MGLVAPKMEYLAFSQIWRYIVIFLGGLPQFWSSYVWWKEAPECLWRSGALQLVLKFTPPALMQARALCRGFRTKSSKAKGKWMSSLRILCQKGGVKKIVKSTNRKYLKCQKVNDEK